MVVVTWVIFVPSLLALEELLTSQSITRCHICILAQSFLPILLLPRSCFWMILPHHVPLFSQTSPEAWFLLPFSLLLSLTRQLQIHVVNCVWSLLKSSLLIFLKPLGSSICSLFTFTLSLSCVHFYFFSQSHRSNLETQQFFVFVCFKIKLLMKAAIRCRDNSCVKASAYWVLSFFGNYPKNASLHLPLKTVWHRSYIWSYGTKNCDAQRHWGPCRKPWCLYTIVPYSKLRMWNQPMFLTMAL